MNTTNQKLKIQNRNEQVIGKYDIGSEQTQEKFF